MRNRKLVFATFLALGIATFNACIDDPEPAALTVTTDVFIQKTVLNGVEKYGLSFWAFGNKELDSVTVAGPGDETWTLAQDENNSFVFIHFPELNQYTDSMPASGNYTFRVASTQNGEAPVTSVDKLENMELEAVTIDSTQFINAKLKTIWTVVEDADAYVVRMYDEAENLIFIGSGVAGNKTNYSFGTSDLGWTNPANKAENGETYRLEVLAILYEPTSTQANQEYNIQFISVASKQIVWGE